MPFVYVYMIHCKNDYLYTGIASNPKKRLKEHNVGLSLLTVNRRPVKLVYIEKFSNRYEAAKREKEIKGWSRKKKERLINTYNKRNKTK